MSTINFESKLYNIESIGLLTLPKSASVRLPSRGATMVKGTINNFHFQAVLEPDGKGSHWLKVDDKMRQAAGISVGDTVALGIEPASEWPEPDVPTDLKKSLSSSFGAHALWMKITPMARWDWIRWINSTKQPETRKRRIEVAISKLEAGKRRPCCFNRTQCTDPYVSNNGVLLVSD